MMDQTKVLSYYAGGNSFPIVIQQNQKKYLVKLRAGLSGEYSLLCEWLGNQIGLSIGINTRKPSWIWLTNALNYQDIYIEVRDLIEKSLGINIGFDYIERVIAFDLGKKMEITREQQVEIFLLDVFMLNIDRTTRNHNLMMHKEGVLISDYDSSLIFHELMNEVDFPENSKIWHCLKSNPFYQQVDKNRLKMFINKINQINLEEIIFNIPADLLSDENKIHVCRRLEDKKQKDWNLAIILNHLETINLETEKEMNARIKMNREQLENALRASISGKLAGKHG